MSTEKERIIRLLEKTFDKQPWYGSPLMEVLKDITPEMANRKNSQTHNINELVAHMTAWRLFVINRLHGDGEFQVTNENNFPRPGTWEETLSKFSGCQERLIEAVKNFPEEKLGDICPSKELKYTYYTLLHGINQHDIYHLGQIALLKKLST